MSFAQQLAEISDKRAKVIQDYKMKKFREFEEAKSKREFDLMTFLTNKYHKSIKNALYDTALICGRREKYMNFEYSDFKANFPELGNPKEVCERWLTEMCDPKSKYLPFKTPEYFESQYLTHFDSLATTTNGQYTLSNSPERDHFSGLQFEVWNNKAFTVYFNW